MKLNRMALLGMGSLVLCSWLLAPVRASALAASDWQAGRIMDDVVFTNKDAMSASGIQNFLNQQVGTNQTNSIPGQCDTNGTQPSEYGGGTRAQWASAHGYSTPFTCLKDYYEVPKTSPGPGVPANNYGGQPIPQGAISAAQIIYNAAQQYSINPKVLLTVLQKESTGPLVTDAWPTASQYTYAMGSHCPDSNSCDSNYAGFSMQIYSAAALFRSYLDGMDQSWWGCTNGSGQKIQCPANGQGGAAPGGSYKVPFTTDYILWNPNSSCGGNVINIQSKATAALYMYTPYQPNAGSLAYKLSGGRSYSTSSPDCGAYGNLNFWMIYNNWFGSTLAPNYAWSSQLYTIKDANNVQMDPGNLTPGQVYNVSLAAKNMGNTTWYNNGDNPVTLATSSPQSHNSYLCDPSWLTCNRLSYLTEASVAPGDIGHFSFTIRAPYTPGLYYEYFKPVAEFAGWFNDDMPNEALGIRVTNPGSFTWSTSGYQVFDQNNARVDPGKLQPGALYTASINATNTGTATWYNSGPTPVTLATANPASHSSGLCSSSWIACNRLSYLTESTIAPGQTGHFTFAFQAPYKPGPYREDFKPVAEFLSWFNDTAPGETLGVVVNDPGTFNWSTTGYIIKDQSGTQVDPGKLTHSQTYTATLTATNTGTATWYNSGPTPVTLATANPASHSSALCNNAWLSCNRLTYLTESSVAPGQVGHFTFTFQAPSTTGPYREDFKPVAEFLSWFNDVPLSQTLGIWVTQ